MQEIPCPSGKVEVSRFVEIGTNPGLDLEAYEAEWRQYQIRHKLTDEQLEWLRAKRFYLANEFGQVDPSPDMVIHGQEEKDG